MSEDSPKRSRGRPRSVQRQPAVSIAMKTYWQDGLHAHSLTALCQRIGLSKPSFYRTFGGEDGLMEAALQHYRQLAIVPLLEMLSSDRPFDALLHEATLWLTADHGAPAGCLFTRMRLAPSSLGPATAAYVRSIEQERRDAFAVCYQRGMERGEVDDTLSPESAAYFIDAQWTGALVLRAVGEPPEKVQAQLHLAFRTLLRTTA